MQKLRLAVASEREHEEEGKEGGKRDNHCQGGKAAKFREVLNNITERGERVATQRGAASSGGKVGVGRLQNWRGTKVNCRKGEGTT